MPLILVLLGTRTLLGAPGIATRSKKLRSGLLALLLGTIGRYYCDKSFFDGFSPSPSKVLSH